MARPLIWSSADSHTYHAVRRNVLTHDERWTVINADEGALRWLVHRHEGVGERYRRTLLGSFPFGSDGLADAMRFAETDSER